MEQEKALLHGYVDSCAEFCMGVEEAPDWAGADGVYRCLQVPAGVISYSTTDGTQRSIPIVPRHPYISKNTQLSEQQKEMERQRNDASFAWNRRFLTILEHYTQLRGTIGVLLEEFSVEVQRIAELIMPNKTSRRSRGLSSLWPMQERTLGLQEETSECPYSLFTSLLRDSLLKCTL